MRTISFLHLDYTLAGKDDAELIRIVEGNGDVLLLLVPDEGIGDLDLQPEDVVISSDTPVKEFNPQKKLSEISNSALSFRVLALEKGINKPMLLERCEQVIVHKTGVL
jgi:hypothetical protein